MFARAEKFHLFQNKQSISGLVSLSGVAGLVVCVDLITKSWAQARGLVSLNTGISFGMLTENVGGVLLLSMVFLAVYFYLFAADIWERPWVHGLFVGGAVANMYDRVVFGAVRDWLPIPFTGLVNNVADWALGAVVVILLARAVWRKGES